MGGVQGDLFSSQELAPAQATKAQGAPGAVRRPERGSALPWEAPLGMPHPNLRLGLCSFTVPDWRGTFYHEDEEDLLAAYAKLLPVVEVDSTFYGIPKPAVVDGWAERTPADFRFCLKFPREITHEKMLEKAEYPTKIFLDVAARLGERLGPLLLQFPYSFRSTHFPHLASYLEKLPKELRYAVEIRHRSWLRQPFFQLLEDHKVALCLLDHPMVPKLDRRTTDFVYVRWLGDRRNMMGPFGALRRDPTLGLKWWVKRLKPMAESGTPVYAFTNDFYSGHAPSTLQKVVEAWK